MKYTTLFTAADQKSHFKEVDAGSDNKKHPLGRHSQKYPAKGIIFRDFEKGAVFDWHNAPQPQYIIYLEGEVEVETSSGGKRIFKPRDILFATDLTGKGHVTRALTNGRSIIVTTEE